MSRMVGINQPRYHIKDRCKLCIIEPPHNSLRPQFDISRVVLLHYPVPNSMEFEGRRTVFVCRSHSGLQHAEPVPICTDENRIIAPVEIRKKPDTKDSHFGPFRG